jgi:hypothetical protein
LKRKELLDIKNKQSAAAQTAKTAPKKEKDPLTFSIFALNFGPYFFLYWVVIFNII